MLKLLALALGKDLVGTPSGTRATILLEINSIISQSIGISTSPAAAP
jgi:hypothetical protein